jgi:hypothetical protein
VRLDAVRQAISEREAVVEGEPHVRMAYALQEGDKTIYNDWLRLCVRPNRLRMSILGRS